MLAKLKNTSLAVKGLLFLVAMSGTSFLLHGSISWIFVVTATCVFMLLH